MRCAVFSSFRMLSGIKAYFVLNWGLTRCLHAGSLLKIRALELSLSLARVQETLSLTKGGTQVYIGWGRAYTWRSS